MNKLLLFFIFSFFLASSTKWGVESSQVKISYILPNQKGRTGTMNGIEAEIDFNPLNIAESKISAMVNVSSLQTMDAGMTKQLLEPDFFDANKYYFITFVSTSFAKKDSGFTTKGDLTIKGKTRSVEIPFAFIQNDSAALFKGNLSIFCGDYGLLSDKENDPESLAKISIEVPVFKK